MPGGFKLTCPIPEFLREKRCASIIKNKPHGGNKNPITFYRGFMHTLLLYAITLLDSSRQLYCVLYGCPGLCWAPLMMRVAQSDKQDDEVKIGWFFPKDKKVHSCTP